MYKTKCLIDGKEFVSEFPGAEKRRLSSYLKKKHKITYEQYILKYVHNNIRPLCACGCGKETKFFKGKFFKYYEDHKNTTKQSDELKEKLIAALPQREPKNSDFVDAFMALDTIGAQKVAKYYRELAKNLK